MWVIALIWYAQAYSGSKFMASSANCFAKAGNLEKAERTYNESLALHPDRPRYWFWYAKFLVDYFPDRIKEVQKAINKAETASDKRWPVKDEELSELREEIETQRAAPQKY